MLKLQEILKQKLHKKTKNRCAMKKPMLRKEIFEGFCKRRENSFPMVSSIVSKP